MIERRLLLMAAAPTLGDVPAAPPIRLRAHETDLFTVDLWTAQHLSFARAVVSGPQNRRLHWTAVTSIDCLGLTT